MFTVWGTSRRSWRIFRRTSCRLKVSVRPTTCYCASAHFQLAQVPYQTQLISWDCRHSKAGPVGTTGLAMPLLALICHLAANALRDIVASHHFFPSLSQATTTSGISFPQRQVFQEPLPLSCARRRLCVCRLRVCPRTPACLCLYISVSISLLLSVPLFVVL